MLRQVDKHDDRPGGQDGSADTASESFEIIDGNFEHGLLLVCDHATNRLPVEYGDLGLGAAQFERHIAYDIGVEGVTRKLAEALDVPAVLSRFSRLLIDPNRGLDDPTLVMRISDGTIVPGNARIDAREIERRIDTYYRPYNDAVSALIDRFGAYGILPALFSIHSFTPAWKGRPRPWHAGVLWDRDKRFVDPLIAALEGEAGLVVGSNEPYSGELVGDMMNRHGTQRGRAHALLEIRQDLIADEQGIAEWSERLARLLPDIIVQQNLHEPFGNPA
jgi:predicted N-formylglutamate amidohydrolase